MSHINRAVLQRIAASSKKEGPQPSSVAPMLQHPARALPPGKQWRAHDGSQARARRRRQQAALELKRLRKQQGSDAVVGQEGDALILDFGTQR